MCSKGIATCMEKKMLLQYSVRKNHGCWCLGSLGHWENFHYSFTSFYSRHILVLSTVPWRCGHVLWASWHLKSLATQMFIQQLVQASIKATLKLCITWLFLREIYQWLVDSPHKGPVMWIVLSCHDVMMDPHHSHFPNKNPHHIDGLVQDCSNSSALAMELLQSCTKLSIYSAMYL